jgi:phosphoribosylformylglycinamidine cyclo-ligase
LFEELKLKPESRLPEWGGTVGDELLKIHVSYGPIVQKLLKKFNKPATRGVKGLAHITGGGFIDNIPRVLPKSCDAIIHKGTWKVLPVFEFLQKKGQIDEAEMYQVFNMGIGMTLFVAQDQAAGVMKFLQREKVQNWLIGEVGKGSGVARVM